MHELIRITSKDSKIVKTVAKLQTKGRSRKENGLFVVEGLRLLKDAYLNGFEFEYVLVSDSGLIKHQNELEGILPKAKASYVMPDSLFLKIADTVTPQGIIGVIAYKSEQTFISGGKYLALENIQNPSNLGAIARSCEAFGITAIIMSDNGCDPLSPKALRASMGALLRIPIFVVGDVTEFLLNNKITTYACVVDKNALPISSVTFKNNCAALIGNEGNGLSDYAKQNSDALITIPMSGRAESLNAAAAATVVLWEMTK